MTRRKRFLLALVVAVTAAVVIFAWWMYPAGPARPITKAFSAEGVSRVIIRAARADSAIAIKDPEATMIEVTGTPSGGAAGYHPTDPFWRETPPQAWGLDFVAAQHGDVLIVSSKSEIHYIHHLYLFSDVRIRVPPAVEVVIQQRKLTGQGEPDLSLPGGR